MLEPVKAMIWLALIYTAAMAVFAVAACGLLIWLAAKLLS